MSRIEGSPPPAMPVAPASGPRAVGPEDTGPARARDGRGSAMAAGAAAGAASPVELSEAMTPGAAPVDADRVAIIRKAIENGAYPLVPTKIADAMIAAGMLWRSPR